MRHGFGAGANAVESNEPKPGGQLLRTLSEPESLKFMKKRILIIGGVAGGASCAARARRLDEEAEIVIFDKGPHVSFANCGLPYYVGEVIREESRLTVASAETFWQRFNIEVRVLNE